MCTQEPNYAVVMSSDSWDAPRVTSAVNAKITIPGSKSATNRALILASLADAPSRITGALAARDTDLMQQALETLGVGFEFDDHDEDGNIDLTVTPAPLHGGTHIDVGLAGTVMRFVPPVAGLAIGDVRFDGDPRARVRPMATIIDALSVLGVSIDDDGRGTLPFTVHGTGTIRGGDVTIDASSSSQFVSGLLLSAAKFDEGVTITHVGSAIPSAPHIQMTIAMLAQHGVAVFKANNQWRVEPQTIRAVDQIIEPDLSNAAPFLAAALVTHGSVVIPRWPAETTQAGDALRHLLSDMGAQVELDDDGLHVQGGGEIRGIDVDLSDVGELTPTIAALASLASGDSRLRGIAHLRGHETDRLAALAAEINALGGQVTETDDGLVISPRPLHGGFFRTYDDHRMATAGAIIGLAVDGVSVENIETTAKTMPDFIERWATLVDSSRR